MPPETATEEVVEVQAAEPPKESWEEKFYTLADVFTEESALTIHLLHKLKLSYSEAVAQMNKEVTGTAAEGIRVISKKVVGQIIDGTYNKEAKEPEPDHGMKLSDSKKQGEKEKEEKKKTPEEALAEFEAFKKALDKEHGENRYKYKEIPVEETPKKKGPIELAGDEKLLKEQREKLLEIIEKENKAFAQKGFKIPMTIKLPPSKEQDWDAEKGAWKKKQ